MAKLGVEHGPPHDLGKVKGSAPNRIYRIGIELEGGWTSLPAGTNDLIHDGSVSIPRDITCPNLRTGELANGPMTMTEWQAWMRSHYPQKVNETCGMHVHLSPRNALVYSRLMDPRYPGTVVAYINNWAKAEGLPKDHPIWARLKGKSIYCQHLYMADDQIRNTQKDHSRERVGHRYTVINYCHGRWGTVECRLLPMLDSVEQATRLVQEYVDITNAFLRVTRKKEPRLEVNIESSNAGGDDLIVEVPRAARGQRIIR